MIENVILYEISDLRIAIDNVKTWMEIVPKGTHRIRKDPAIM